MYNYATVAYDVLTPIECLGMFTSPNRKGRKDLPNGSV